MLVISILAVPRWTMRRARDCDMQQADQRHEAELKPAKVPTETAEQLSQHQTTVLNNTRIAKWQTKGACRRRFLRAGEALAERGAYPREDVPRADQRLHV